MLICFVDKGNSLRRIEKQLIRYLPKAFEEFTVVKAEYTNWIESYLPIIKSVRETFNLISMIITIAKLIQLIILLNYTSFYSYFFFNPHNFSFCFHRQKFTNSDKLSKYLQSLRVPEIILKQSVDEFEGGGFCSTE